MYAISMIRHTIYVDTNNLCKSEFISYGIRALMSTIIDFFRRINREKQIDIRDNCFERMYQKHKNSHTFSYEKALFIERNI